ncbi:hypothetical protein PLICRDRAFT_41839 [Plicaturopsis crispa FD-325 SS-3]|nr:hypothetical protein PLICRDRAFT_41839 [Plicaturopsis crispa FD-325 SS-3]
MSFRPGAVLLHAAAAGIMAYGYMGLSTLPLDAHIRSQKGGHLQFLTIQGLCVAWLTMAASLVADLFPSATSIKRVKRALFMISLPLAVVISSIYWTLLLAFPHLIMQAFPTSEPTSSPSAPAIAYVPLPIDLALHAAPALTLVADFFLLERKYTRSEARWAPLVTAVSTVWYGAWVEYLATFNKTFPYPFLTENPFEIRVAIYGGAALLALVSFWGINGLHR